MVGVLVVDLDDVDFGVVGVEGVDFEDVVDGVEGVVVREDVGVDGVEVEGVDGQDELKNSIVQFTEQYT